MPTAGVTHDVVFGQGDSSYGFMVVPGSYRVERADDFAPRIATGNEPSLREGIWDAWAMSGASEGIDQLTFVNRNRIYRSDGNVFLNRDQAMQLESAWVTSDASKTLTAPMSVDMTVSATDYTVFAAATKIRRYNIGADTYTDSTTTLGANGLWLHVHNGTLYVACGSGADYYTSTDLITFTQPSAGEKASVFCTWGRNGVINLVKAYGTSFKVSTDNGATWGSAISVGLPDTNITGLAVAFGLLVIGKEDGLYYYDGTNVVEELLVPHKRHARNFRALVYHEGFLYTSILNAIVKLSFSSGGLANMVDITPTMQGDANKELYGHGLPVWLWSGPRHLYVLLDDGETQYTEVLYYTGLGWHQYARSAGTTPVTGGYSRLGSRIWYNDASTYYRTLGTLTDLPAATNFAATGVFETSDYDAGLPFMYKAFRDVMIDCRNISAGSIKVEYSIDSGSTWVEIATVANAGVNYLAFPNATPVAGYRMRLRFTLTRNAANSTPVLMRFVVRFLNRPQPIYAESITLRIAPGQELRDGTRETAGVPERMAFLASMEGSREPVRFDDMSGGTETIYITKTSRSRYAEKPIDTTYPPEEWLVNVTMIQTVLLSLWGSVQWGAFNWG